MLWVTVLLSAVVAVGLAVAVAAIEDAMYAEIDAITGEDVDAILDFLRTYINRSPSGLALARRIALTDQLGR